MVSETSLAAQQCRLREWAEQIRDCQNRAEGMSVIEWCSRNGITKANYYYRLRCVRAACLEQFPEETAGRQVIPVPSGFLYTKFRKKVKPMKVSATALTRRNT